MKYLTVVLALGCALGVSAQSNGQDKDDRVRAKEPTVVTVYGSRENVDAQKAPQPERSGMGKVGHGLRTGFSAVGKGIVGFAGWLANVDDDIPKKEDREQEKSAKQR